MKCRRVVQLFVNRDFFPRNVLSAAGLALALTAGTFAVEGVYCFTIARKLGANLLLNIGPRADGYIHPYDGRTLREVG